MKSSHLVITLSSGEVIEHRTVNPKKYLNSLKQDYPDYQSYCMLKVLNLESLVKGYIVTVKTLDDTK